MVDREQPPAMAVPEGSMPEEESPAELPEPPLKSHETEAEPVLNVEAEGETTAEVAEEGSPSPAEEPPAPSGPRQILVPSPSWFTLLLILLNLVAGLVLGYLLLLDYTAHRTWSSALLLRDLVLWGLPLNDQEAERGSAAQEVRPTFHLRPEQLAKAYQERMRGGKGGKFAAVEEAIGQPLKPGQLSQEILQELFRGLSPPVRTWKEEADRVQQEFFSKVQEAADKLPGLFKDEGVKRRQLADLLLSLAARPEIMEELDKQLQELPARELDNWLRDAGQRWVLLNQLRLLAAARPAMVRDNSPEEQKQLAAELDFLAQAAHPGRVKLEQLQDRLRSRFQEAQQIGTSLQQRQRLAFLLYSLSKARQPANPNDWLDPQQSQRVAVVVGLVYYNLAAVDLAQALLEDIKHLQNLLDRDRNGYAVQSADGQLRTVPGFVGRYQALVQRLLELAADLNEQEARLKRLQELEARQEQQYRERSANLDELVVQLLQVRQETARLAAEVHRLEEELFRAQRERADAAQINQELERQIRTAEQHLLRRAKP